jgi:hypothetical protein
MYPPCATNIPKDCNEKYYCVKKGMGGHEGAFINFIDPAKKSKCKYIECGKKFQKNDKELVIYKKLHKLVKNSAIPSVFLEHFSNFHKKYCSINGVDYFSIENLNKNLGNNVRNIDIKLGYKSAFKHDSGLFKSTRHKFINTKYSTSHEYGFRLEGTTLKDDILEANKNSETLYNDNIDKYIARAGLPASIKDLLYGKIEKDSLSTLKKKEKYDLYVIHPLIVLNIFFKHNKKKANDLYDKLFDMVQNFILPNIKTALRLKSKSSSKKKAIGFVGSSLFLLYGSKDVRAKIIDIAHPYILDAETPDKTKENSFKVIYNMTMGVLSFIIILDYWIYINDNTWIKKNKNARKLISSSYALFIKDKESILKFKTFPYV